MLAGRCAGAEAARQGYAERASACPRSDHIRHAEVVEIDPRAAHGQRVNVVPHDVDPHRHRLHQHRADAAARVNDPRARHLGHGDVHHRPRYARTEGGGVVLRLLLMLKPHGFAVAAFAEQPSAAQLRHGEPHLRPAHLGLAAQPLAQFALDVALAVIAGRRVRLREHDLER